MMAGLFTSLEPAELTYLSQASLCAFSTTALAYRLLQVLVDLGEEALCCVPTLIRTDENG